METINLTDFQKRKFKNFYITLYVVTKEIKIRTDSAMTEKNLHILIGIDIKGRRQILGVYFDNTNDNRFWLEKFEDIKARGVEKILFFVTPKNKNIEKGLKILYNDVEIINSPDEIYKNITQFFAERPSRKMQINFKDLFLKKNIEEYRIDLDFFKERYIDNKIINILISKKEAEIEKFYKYNYSLRKLLYPYYLIREMQKNLNKLTYREKLCTNINEVIEAFLPYINSFEQGRSYSKVEWLELMSDIYEDYSEVLEEYING
ncbi:MAG: transposase [Bacilli bacterium]|nr:transposase [Bacilli bacterium]